MNDHYRIEYVGKTNEDLVEESADGNDDAFEELVRRHMRPVFSFIRHYTSPEDAEDIVQEVFYKFWKHIKRFTRGRSFKPWLYTIARNAALDFLKKKRPETFSELSAGQNESESPEESVSETFPDPEPLPSEIFEHEEQSALVNKLLNELEPDKRIVFILHYSEQMSFEEIATLLKISVNTVKSWHRRSLPLLREFIDNRWNK